jgi:uncharacterized SAM-binding protein YcdF (DUF218 family)
MRRRVVLTGSAVICAAALLYAFSGRVLWSLGAILNSNEIPQEADMIVVLGGDYDGSRILTAAELVREGYAPRVLVSGAGSLYGHHESDLSIDFAVQHGYPRDEFIPFRYPAVSTADEARADLDELRRRGVHKYLLVTSVYHTARAGRVFRREGASFEMQVIAAPDRYWQNGQWWKNREGRKLWFFETVKTIADWFRI